MTDSQITIHNARNSNTVFTLIPTRARDMAITYYISKATGQALMVRPGGVQDVVSLDEARSHYAEHKPFCEQWQGEGHNRFKIA
jgi:hypothetical protein